MGPDAAHHVQHHEVVHARADLAEHLHHGDPAPLEGQRLSRLKPCHARSYYYDPPLRTGTPQQHILRGADEVKIRSGDRRDAGFPATRQEDAAGVQPSDVLGGDLPPQPDLYPGTIDLGDQGVDVFCDLVLAVTPVGGVQGPAQPLPAVEYDRGESALLEDQGGLDTRWAAADHGNGAPLAVADRVQVLALATGLRVHRAPHLPEVGYLSEAAEAAYTPSNDALTAGEGLGGPFRVRQQAAADSHEVADPLFEQGFGDGGVLDVAHGYHGDGDGLLDRRRHILLPPLLVRPGLDAAEAVAAHVDRVRARPLQSGGDPGGLFGVDPPREALLGVDADRDGEVLPAAALYPCEDLLDEPHAVLEGPPVPVGAEVHGRGEELVDQVAVGAVKLHSIRSRGLRHIGGEDELADHLGALVLGQFARHVVWGRWVGHRGGGHRGLARHQGGGHAAGVLKLDEDPRAVLLNGAGQPLEVSDIGVPVSSELARVADAPAPFDPGHLGDDETDATLCPRLVEGDDVIGHAASRGRQVCPHRGHYHAVGDGQAPYLALAPQSSVQKHPSLSGPQDVLSDSTSFPIKQ